MVKKFKIGASGIIILVMLLTLLILKSHRFQTFLINRIIAPIEKNADVEIKFSHSGFDLFDGFFIEDLVINDNTASSLLTIDIFKISPQSTFLSLLKNDFSFDHAFIKGARVNIYNKTNDSDSNWDRFFSSFQNGSSGKEKKENLFFIKEIDIEDLWIDINDKSKELEGYVKLKRLEILSQKISLETGHFDINNVLLLNPDIYIKSCSSKPKNEAQNNTKPDNPKKELDILLSNLSIINANVSLTSRDDKNNDTFFSLRQADAVIDDISFKNIYNYQFTPRDISLVINDNLELDHLNSDQILCSSTALNIQNLLVRSNLGLVKINGNIKDKTGIDYTHIDRAEFDLDIANSYVDINKLNRLIPSLSAEYWYQNLDLDKLHLNGQVIGTLNDLTVNNVHIVVPNLLTYAGSIDILNLTNIDQALINLIIDHSKIHLDEVSRKIPNIKIPKELVRLGTIELDGIFDGFKNNFVAEVDISSALGNLAIDLNFNIEEENQYKGLLKLNSFDLGSLLNEKDLGRISLSADITEGSGLNFESLKAVMSADIDTLQYKGYTYTNGLFNGKMSNKSIDGNLSVFDKNIDFSFNGRMDFSTAVPNAKFKIDIGRIDLCEANLTDFPCEMSLMASIDLYGQDINSLQGTALLDSIYMKKDGRDLSLNYLTISSKSVEQGMLLELSSDEIDAKIRGVFDIRTMHKVLLNLLISDYPDIAQRLNVPTPTGLTGQEEFDFALEVKNMTDILGFLQSKQLLEIEGELRGRWSSAKGLTSNSYDLKNVTLNGLKLSNVIFNLDSKDGDGIFSLFIDELRQGDRIFDGFEIFSKIKKNEILFDIKNDKGQENVVNISGHGNPWRDGFKFVFDNNVLRIDSLEWVLDADAAIGYSDNKIFIDNFIIQGGDQTLILDDIDGQGISLIMNGFDLALINPFVDYDKMYFEGISYIDIKAKNLFNKRELSLDLNIPNFTINQDDYGSITLHANEGKNEMIDLSIKIEKDSQALDVLAYYDLKENLLNADISIIDYPMSIFEYIIDDGISQTVGTTDVNARIYGPLTDLKLQGQGVINNGGTRIDYLGEFYKMEDQIIKINEKTVDLTGVELIDHLGNKAVITGVLNHDFLADFTADVSVSSQHFVGLNTTYEDNESYYGTGLGDISVSFFGPFEEIDIRVDAITGAGSSLNIPLESNAYALDKGFVNFDYNSQLDTSSRIKDAFEALRLSGADFEMNLSFTPEANVNVIFDQSVDEVLAAKGSGNLRVTVKRDGTFEVFGNYLVESGEYLYSAYGITAKRFLLRRGGVVRWTGDPYNAIIDVEADYSGMRAPLDIFLSEFLISASETVRNEAKNRTDVALKLLLRGTLFQPDVNFNISFPDVTGELKTYTDNKMRSLRTTENGINNQVFGLMFFNNFLPNNNPLANLSGSTLGQTGNNTITEFFSSQLSLLVSDALSDLIKDGTFISDIDFDIALSQNTSFIDGQSNEFIGGLVDFVPDQVGVNVRPTFTNENWALNVGTNYVRASEANNVNYLTGDFALDWFITNDKKLKLRFYGDFDYDEAFASRKQRYGFGINYRREFGKMTDLTETLKKIAKDVKNQSLEK
ncbi:MAG: hypothetical protein V3V00_12340 [Saprospiraceae bacterium]